MRLAFAVAAALALATPTFAQDAQTEAARRHADALISAAGAQGIFENVTDDPTPRVRHGRSGLTCAFTTGDRRDSLHVYEVRPGGPVRGDDVSCARWYDGVLVSVFATRYQERYPAGDVFQSAMVSVTRNWPQATPHSGELKVVTLGAQPRPLIGGFDVELNGRPSTSLVLVRHIDDWSFKARATGPADGSVDLLAGVAFATSLPDAPEED